MATQPSKDDGALRTIGELSEALGRPAHILRYWEKRFPQLRPLQRAGGRRYYRPADVALARHIDRLLNEEGYTIEGAVRALASASPTDTAPQRPAPINRVRAVRDRLARALSDAGREH